MNRRLAVHGDNNSANGFFALRLPEICGRKAGRVIEHGEGGGWEGRRRNRSKETKGRVEQWRGQRIPMPWECFHLCPTTNKCAPVSGFYNWPEVVQLRKHDAAGWGLLHFESFLSLSFLFSISPPPLAMPLSSFFPFSSYFLRPPTPLPPMPPTRHCQRRYCAEIYREDGWIIRI